MIPSQLQNLDNAWIETLLDLGLLGIIPLAVFALTGWPTHARRAELGAVAPAFAGLYFALIAASFVNPSIQAIDYPMIILGIVILAQGKPAADVGASAANIN